MASSDPELKDGFTLSGWMKSKPARHSRVNICEVNVFNVVNRIEAYFYDISIQIRREFEPFAGSPPPPEDSFFYIRYPKTDVLFGKPRLDQEGPKVFAEQSNEVKAPSAYNIVKEKDWSKHTKPCQDVLHGIAPINTSVNPGSSKPKPAGTDDGFKGEGAACGTSIVKVANQIISSKSSRGFTVASPEEEEHAVAPELHQYKLMHRRGSKSLPASPAHSPPGSPTSRRKMNGNRFFTSPYEPVEDASAPRSWLSMALLGLKKELGASTSTLAEEDGLEVHTFKHGHLAESVENLGPSPKRKETINSMSHEPETPAKPAIPQAYRPKPSELREMNFWSPTSM